MAESTVDEQAAEELRKIDQSQITDLEAGVRRSAGAIALPSVGTSRFSPGTESLRPSKELLTIDDLYATYPEVGLGEWQIRVERLEPRVHQGISISGHLGDFRQRLTLDDFARKWGGGKYLVTVMQPYGDTVAGTMGYRSKGNLKLRIPGEPESEDDMQRMAFVEAPQAQVVKHENEFKREQLRVQENEKNLQRLEQSAEQVNKVIQASNENIVNHMSRQSEATIAMYAKQCDELRAELKSKEEENVRLRAELVTAKTEAANAQNNTESKLIGNMRADHLERLQQLASQHTAEITRINEAARKDIDTERAHHTAEKESMRERQADALQQMRTSHDIELRTVRENYDHERERMREDAAAKIDAMKATYENRVADLKESAARELQTMRDRLATEVKVVEENASSRAVFSEKSAEVQIKNLESQLNHQRAEYAQLRAQLDEAHAKIYRPTTEVLRETQELARAIGMVDASEASPPAEGSQEPTWLSLTKVLLQDGPKLLQPFLDSRQRGQPPAQMRVQQQPVQYVNPQQQHAQQQQMRRLQQPQQQQQRYPQLVPRQESSMRTPMSLASMPASVPSQSAPVSLAANVGLPPTVAAGVSATMENISGVPVQAAPVAVPQEVQATPPSVEVQAQPAPVVVPEGTQVSESDQVKLLVQELDRAISSKEDPAVFAKQLVDSIGVEVARQLTASPTSELVDVLVGQYSAYSSAIGTRDGRKFLTRVIDKARELANAG